jgi:hypothetical protein
MNRERSCFMEMKIISFDKKKGKPSVEILIGQAHHGSYRVYLWDAQGKKSKLIGSGVNWDEAEDVIDPGTVNLLNQRIITWEVAVSAEDAQPGQHYSVQITFKQGGEPIQDGSIDDNGPLDGSKFVYGARRIVVD